MAIYREDNVCYLFICECRARASVQSDILSFVRRIVQDACEIMYILFLFFLYDFRLSRCYLKLYNEYLFNCLQMYAEEYREARAVKEGQTSASLSQVVEGTIYCHLLKIYRSLYCIYLFRRLPCYFVLS